MFQAFGIPNEQFSYEFEKLVKLSIIRFICEDLSENPKCPVHLVIRKSKNVKNLIFDNTKKLKQSEKWNKTKIL